MNTKKEEAELINNILTPEEEVEERKRRIKVYIVNNMQHMINEVVDGVDNGLSKMIDEIVGELNYGKNYYFTLAINYREKEDCEIEVSTH